MKKIALYILCGVMALFTSCDPSLLDLQNENTLKYRHILENGI